MLTFKNISEPTQYEYPGEAGGSSAPSSGPDYTIDYASLDYNQQDAKVTVKDYDAFDYVNGDFDKVTNKDKSKTFPPTRHKGNIIS